MGEAGADFGSPSLFSDHRLYTQDMPYSILFQYCKAYQTVHNDDLKKGMIKVSHEANIRDNSRG